MSVRSVAGVAICLEHLLLDAAPRRDPQSVGRGPYAHSGGVDAVGGRLTGVRGGAATTAARPRSSIRRNSTVLGATRRRDVRPRLLLVRVGFFRLCFELALFGLVLLGLVPRGLVPLGLVPRGLVRLSLVRLSLVPFGLVPLGLVPFGLVLFGLVGFGLVGFGLLLRRVG